MINPELRRYIWLDFSLHRLLLTPTVICLFLYLVYLLSTSQFFANLAFDIGCFFIFLWGTKNASEAVLEEVNNNTWDFQRQSTLQPWAMAWGKLLGSTAFSWYGAFISFIIYALANKEQSLFSSLPLSQELFLVMVSGLFGQAIALLLSLQVLPTLHRRQNPKTFRYFLLGATCGVLMVVYCLQAVKLPMAHVDWFYFTLSLPVFATISLLLFSGWSLIGLQRSFARELQYYPLPWVWIVFNVFLMFYFAGLNQIGDLNLFSHLKWEESQLAALQSLLKQLPSYTAFFIVDFLLYFALFSEEITLVRYKKLLMQIQAKNPKESLQRIPLWIFSFILFVLAGSFILIRQLSQPSLDGFSPAIFVITSILFTCRDILLIHYFNFGKQTARVMGTIVLYLLLLYLIIPFILNALHIHLLAAFIPSAGDNTGLALLSACSQIGLLGVLCCRRWKMAWQEK